MREFATSDKWAIGNPHVLITASITYCTNEEGVDVSDLALPHLTQWMREHAHELGYIHVSEAPTATVHRVLASTAPPVVVVIGDCE